MKKLTALLLTIIIMMNITVAFAGGSETLISKSYMDGDLKQKLTASVESVITKYSVNPDLSEAQRIYDSAASRIIPSGYSVAPAYVQISAPMGSRIKMASFASLIMVSGNFKLAVNAGEVIDLSAAESVSGKIRAKVRYFTVEDTEAVYTAESDSICLVSGPYILENGAHIDDTFIIDDIDESDPYYDAAMYLCENDIMSRVYGVSFEPETDITIHQLLKAVWNIAGRPGDSPERWASENGIWNTVDGNMTVTHEEMAYILYKYAAVVGMDSNSSLNLHGYDDNNIVNPNYKNAVQWAMENGIIRGSIDTVIEPADYTTRGQAAIALYALLNM